MKKTKGIGIKTGLGLPLLLAALLAIVPFVVMFVFSLTQKKTLDLVIKPEEFSNINYRTIFLGTDIVRYFINSCIVVIGSCFFNNLFSSMAAYAFAKKRFRGRNALVAFYVTTMMIPGQVTLVPVFLIMKTLGMLNTYTCLIIPAINAFGVFLIRQFMMGIPDELIEAATIDGCGECKLFIEIVLPLMKPVLVSLTIFTFISSWGNYLWPLIMTTTDKMQTLTLAIATLEGNASVNYGLVMAGATLSFTPPFLLYVFLQKQFVEGVAMTGIKG